jgi:hypothetical protein
MFTTSGAPDDTDQLVTGNFFAQVSRRLGFEHLEEFGIVGVGGKNDYRNIGRVLFYPAG